jgi:hypothetical protein
VFECTFAFKIDACLSARRNVPTVLNVPACIECALIFECFEVQG